MSEKTQILKWYFVISYHVSCNNIFLLIKGHQVHAFSYSDSSGTLQMSLPISQVSTQNCNALLALKFFTRRLEFCHNWIFYLSCWRLKLGDEFSFSWHLLWTFNSPLLILTLPGYTYPDWIVMAFFNPSRIVRCWGHRCVIWYCAVSSKLLVPMYLSHRQTHMNGRAIMRHNTWKRNVLIQGAGIHKIHHTLLV